MKSEWKIVKLGQLCRFQAGNAFPKKEQGKIDGDIPFIKVSDMNLPKNKRKIYTANNWITKDTALRLKINVVPNGAVVFAKIGEALKAERLREVVLSTAIDNNMMAAIPNQNVENGFINFILEDIHLSHYAEGSALPYLRQRDLECISVLLPPKEEQKKIVAILRLLDDRIEINQQINDNLQQQVSTLFDFWFVSFDRTNGEIPADWTEGTLGDIASITSGKRPPMKQATAAEGVQIPLVGAASIMGFTNAVLYNEPILVTGRVGTHGVVQRFQTSCWTSDNTLVIKSSFYEFTYQILQRADYVNMNRGSTQPLITQTDLKNVSITLPTETVLLEFEELAGSLMAMYEANRRENDRLAAMRDTLLPRLMSGEIDVSDIEI